SPLHVALDVPDDRVGDIHPCRFFDAFEARRGVDFEHHRSLLRFEQIDPGDPQTEDAGGRQSGPAIVWRQAYHASPAAAVKVRAEFARDRLPAHRGDDSLSYHERPDVRAVRLLDELLNEDVLVQPLKGFHDRVRGLFT